jgi:hypothetical protein
MVISLILLAATYARRRQNGQRVKKMAASRHGRFSLGRWFALVIYISHYTAKKGERIRDFMNAWFPRMS